MTVSRVLNDNGQLRAGRRPGPHERGRPRCAGRTHDTVPRVTPEPLFAALRAHGEAQPDVMADIIGSMVVRASRDVWSPNKRTGQRRLRAALALAHNLLGPYLELPTGATIVGERCVEANHAVREQRRGRDGDRRLVLVDASQDRPVEALRAISTDRDDLSESGHGADAPLPSPVLLFVLAFCSSSEVVVRSVPVDSGAGLDDSWRSRADVLPDGSTPVL